MRPSRQLAFLWGGAALACVAAAPWAPALARGLPPCPFRALVGIPCLTCGGTRALLALARLDAGAAFSWNPLAAVAGSLLVLGGFVALAAALAGRGVETPRPTPGLRAGLVLSALANWAFLVAAGR
ncbi:MAG TPA: DUF2752 domain-containing protein [Thermoanaerobaculia bacterium]|nr:DUF2752 domain-containing protein [Thermoanaerobaculia bacterium]